MSYIKIGTEPAFPVTEHVIAEANLGMSKRFYAACAAMQGILANPDPEMMRLTSTQLAEMAYEHVDELLKQENL
jgi:hypothetical protein